MIPLKFDISVVGAANVDRALAGVERRYVRAGQRIDRSLTPRRRGAGTASGGIGGAIVAEQKVAHRERLRQIKVEEAAERNRARAVASLDRQRSTALMSQFRKREAMAARAERAERSAAARRARADTLAARRASAARQQFARATVGTVGRSVGGSLRAVGAVGGSALAIGGGFALAGAIRNEMSVQGGATALANQAFREGTGPSREQIKRSVIDQARELGPSSGLGSEGVISALRQFAAISGRLDLGQKLAPFLTDVASATDADIGDVGKTAGQIAQNIGAKGIFTDQQILEQTTDIIAAMAGQAKVGSIEFQDLATEMGSIMSATAGFEGKISELANTMGAVAQIAIAGGATSPAEAMTAIMNLRKDIIQNQDRFKKTGGLGHGVDVFTDKSRSVIRDPVDIIMDMLRVSKGDLSQVSKLFGIRAEKAVQPFQEAFVKSGGVADPEVGLKAVQDLLDTVRKAKMSTGEIQASAAFRREQPDTQFNIAAEKFNAAMGKELLPVVTKLVPEFVKLIPVLTDAAGLLASFVSEFAENPFPTLAKIIALKLAADIAGAGIGAAAKAALTAALSSLPSVAMPGGPGAGMAAVGVGSKVAAVGMIGAAGFGAYQVGTSFIDDAAASQNRRNKALAESSLAGDLALTPGAGREEKEAALARQKKSLTELEKGPSAFDAFFGGLASDLSGLGIIDQDIEHPGKAHARKVEETRQNIAALESSIRDKVSAELEAGAKRAADVFVQRVSEAQPPGPNRSNAPTQPTVM